MLRHCSATEYSMLSLRQDAVMIMGMEEDTEINNQSLDGINFNFLQFKERVLLSLCRC